MLGVRVVARFSLKPEPTPAHNTLAGRQPHWRGHRSPPEVGSSRPELRTRALPPSPVSTPGLRTGAQGCPARVPTAQQLHHMELLEHHQVSPREVSVSPPRWSSP